jgi:hypothetical protein
MNIASEMESLFKTYKQNQQESTLIERIKEKFNHFNDFCDGQKEGIVESLKTLDVLRKFSNEYKTVTNKDFRTALDHKSGLYKFVPEENGFIINYYSIDVAPVGTNDMFRVSFTTVVNPPTNEFTSYLTIYRNSGYINLSYGDLDNMTYTKEELHAIDKCLEKMVNKFREILRCSGFLSVYNELNKTFEDIKLQLQ